MATHDAPITEGTTAIVNLVGLHAARWIEPHDSGGAATDDAPLPRVRCSLYKRGHIVHFIQAKLGLRTPSQAFTLLTVDGPELTVADDGQTQTWWTHDTDFATAALLLDEQPVVHLHEHGLARIGTTLFYPHTDNDEPLDPCTWHPTSDVDANGRGYL